MQAIPGTLRNGGAAFGSTRWSMVQLAAQREAPEAAHAALTAICQAYWPPLYTFLRRRGHAPADAQDLVQAFFVHLMEQDSISRVCRDKGRLRTFLLGSLQYFLANAYDRTRALKRGGDQQIISLDENFLEAEAALHTGHDDDVASCYDRTWAATLMGRAWEQLRTAMAEEGKAEWLQAVKPLLLGGAEPAPSQEQLATRLKLHPSTLRTSLQRLRQRFRQILREEVARTVATSSEIDEETRYLCHVLISEKISPSS